MIRPGIGKLVVASCVVSCLVAGCGRQSDEPSVKSPTPIVPAGGRRESAEVRQPGGKQRPQARPVVDPVVPNRVEVAASPKTAATQVDFQPDRETFTRIVVPFLNAHCRKCHGPDKQEADFRVDRHLPNDFLKRDVATKWGEVLSMLNQGDMPPRGEAKPNARLLGQVVDWITRERRRAARARHDGDVVLRRMNREEYNNTIRDLIGGKMQLVEEFPEDPPAAGFDNNGSALTISPFHLELYLKSARRILDRAIVDEARGPRTIKWHFELEDGLPNSPRRRVHLDDDQNRNILLTCGARPPRNGMVVLRHWGEPWTGVNYFTPPEPGQYVIRIRAAGAVPAETFVRSEGPKIDLRRRQEDWARQRLDDAKKREQLARYDRWSRPLVVQHYATDRSYRYGPPRLQVVGIMDGRLPVLASFDVTAPLGRPRTYEIPALFRNKRMGINLSNQYRIPFAPWFNPHFVVQRDDFPRPELHIDWIEIEGPIHDAWPPTSHTRILFDSPNKGRNERAYAREVLARFMERAFRRPVAKTEVETYAALFDKIRPGKPSFAEAIKVPLSAVLASPHFLYLVEAGADDGRPLNNFELASRLSYFLWSSMPDAELFRLAKAGRLNNPQTLRAQADRMLRDSKSRALVKNFAGQWLGLRKVGTNPPVAHRYDRHLESSMRGETEAFFEHILRNDRSTLEFLNSDYVTINERMARYYDISGVKGDHFRPVRIPAGKHRGGLLGQASILAITSNGTRTSPVWRGVWILDRLLGDSPPPPPPNAGDIPPVAKQNQNKITLRQRLQQHRSNVQCARCHNKIDPLGFALENFNHAGEWRDRDGTRRDSPAIDAAARLPDGAQFTGFDGLRSELLRRQDQFLRCLATKFSTYALGRELGDGDDALVADAVRAMNANGRTLRALIHHIVNSPAFQRK